MKDQIENFPVSPGSLKRWHGDWYCCLVAKFGSETKMYLRFIEEELPQVIFHNDQIEDNSLLSYQDAAQLIPDYVSSPVYRELLTDEQKRSQVLTLMRLKGFREVYAGPSLYYFLSDRYEGALRFVTSLKLEQLPEEIATSIESQVSFIITALYLNQIDHGHIHSGNINVRFLLEGNSKKEDGPKKYISFDLNQALKLAKENNWTITPIVILRDWDQARSH